MSQQYKNFYKICIHTGICFALRVLDPRAILRTSILIYVLKSIFYGLIYMIVEKIKG